MSPAAPCSPAWSAATSAPGAGGARSSSACVVAIASTALCAWAALQHQFWLLVAGATLAGYYNANAGLYRFAATEIVAPEFKERAISWVLAGGIIGAVAGPNLAQLTRNAAAGRVRRRLRRARGRGAAASLATISWIALPAAGRADARPRRAGRCARSSLQPVFIVAVCACAFGYGVMNLLMAATPIAMAMCSHPFSSTALVLEWHVLGMFVPSFFTGHLIRRFGAVRVMAAGVVAERRLHRRRAVGRRAERFLIALFTLGVGWNFLFIGGTSLVTTAYRPEEKTRAQAAMDTTIFATMTLTSFSSGALVTTQGWTLAQHRLDRARCCSPRSRWRGTRRAARALPRARPA